LLESFQHFNVFYGRIEKSEKKLSEKKFRRLEEHMYDFFRKKT